MDLIGIASAEPFLDAAERMKEYINRGLMNERLEYVDAFCDPRSVLSTAKSIIAVAECYLTSESEDLTSPGNPHGRIARYTWRNYYFDVYTKLKKLAKIIKNRVGDNFKFKCYSNGPLAEKPMAQRAGLGWYGKNGIILTQKFGSWIVLGELITNIELEIDDPLNKSCSSCQRCIENCPTKAIIEPYVLDRSKCIQHISQRLSILPHSLRELWGNRLYGCISCQEVCPLNQHVKPIDRKPKYGYVGPSLPLIPLLSMNEKEYRQRFRGNQIAEWWVSFSAIRRNAIVALGNIGDQVAIPTLSNLLKNSRSKILRGHAAWALGKIGGNKVKTILHDALKKESDNYVRSEIEHALHT